MRATSADEQTLQAWLQSALRGLEAGKTGDDGKLYEVDSNGDGTLDNNDVNNYTLGQDLGAANQLCSRFVNARQQLFEEIEMSLWDPTVTLWVSGAAAAGRISCSHAANATSITLIAQDFKENEIHRKVIYPE